MQKREPLIYFLKSEQYSGPQPAFYNKEDFPAAEYLENNWNIIKDEMLSTQSLELSSPTYDPNQSKNSKKWKMVIFYNYLWKKSGVKRFPNTFKLIKDIPGITYAALNLLEPHADIKPHYGDTNATMRCHIGIEIPASLPECGIEVGGQQQSWQEGKVLVFSDAHYHRAWNHSDKNRYVFVVDVIRPEYSHQRYWICAGVLSALSLKTINSRIHVLSQFPPFLLTILHSLLQLFWWVHIRIQEI